MWCSGICRGGRRVGVDFGVWLCGLLAVLDDCVGSLEEGSAGDTGRVCG